MNIKQLLSFVSVAIIFAAPSKAQSFTYLPIDSTKQKWGDWDEPEWLRYFGLDAGDVNRDGLQDILSGRYLYLNPGDDLTASWEKVVLDDNVDGIFLMDVDGDPFADIIAQALPAVYWYEATDESARHFSRRQIAEIPATSHVNSQGFTLADVSGNGHSDILIAGNGNVYAIEISELPGENIWNTTLIGPNTSDEGIGTGDIDGDGDIDIVCGRRKQGENEPTILVWFRNPGVLSSNWESFEIGETEHPIDRIALGDLNGDGSLEIIMAEERYPGKEPDGSIFWYKSGTVLTEPWEQHLVVTQYSSNNLDLADYDADGDLDLLTCEHKGPTLELQVWENNGEARFEKQVLDTGKENHLGTQWVDLDGDGDLDIIGSAWDHYEWVHVWRNDLVDISGTIYEGADHFVITGDGVTWYYDREGGGFSRMIDSDGNDWISFKREPWGEYPASAASSFRGIPNLVFKGPYDGAGHPGHQQCTSTVNGQVITTETKDGAWKWTWTFGATTARLDVLKTPDDAQYWFLYEGTPGGSFSPSETFFGTNLTDRHGLNYDYYSGDILVHTLRWAYVGREDHSNILFLSHLTEDDQPDMISMLGDSEDGLASQDGMTVWGFGRNDQTEAFLEGRHSFIIGFLPAEIIEGVEFNQLEQAIPSSFLPLRD